MRGGFFLMFLFLTILCCEFSEETLGVVENRKKKTSFEDDGITFGIEETDETIKSEKKSKERPDSDNAKSDDDNDDGDYDFISPTGGIKSQRVHDYSRSENEAMISFKVNEPMNAQDILERSKINIMMIDHSKIIEGLVRDFESLHEEEIDEEELPPEPVVIPKELTPEELEGKRLYEEALQLLNKLRPQKDAIYQMLLEASNKGNLDAKALIAWAKLFGNPLKQDINVAMEMFKDLAETGHPEGHTGMGFLYASGLAVNVSQAKAMIHYTFGAIGGNTWAQMIMGYRHLAGVNVAANCETALDYYRLVADKVSQGVSFSGGATIERIRILDEVESGYSSGIIDNDLFEYYQLLAEKGDIKAQVGLGQLHYRGGRGIYLDYQKAMHYFTQAADAGNPMAMAYLGKIYLDGSDEVEANNNTALKYFKKAAELNNPVGQSGLGLMYLHGSGVDKDYHKAYQYFLAAADQGWVDGQLQLGNMYLNGLGVKQDFKLANKYFSLASQSGHVLAYYNLAHMHAKGTGILRSCTTAVELFKNVAERGRWGEILMQAHSDYRDGLISQAFVQYALLSELGYEVAQSNAAFMLDRGEVKMFTEHEAYLRALVYWSRAAAQGYSAAQVKVGDYHYYGLGTSIDYEAAATLYRVAAEHQNNAQAMFNLGYMHEQGLGMIRDIHLAKRCYDLAAETSSDAKIPVALALFKLNFVMNWDQLSSDPFPLHLFDVTQYFGADWDLYVLSCLMALLTTILYFRRPQV